MTRTQLIKKHYSDFEIKENTKTYILLGLFDISICFEYVPSAGDWAVTFRYKEYPSRVGERALSNALNFIREIKRIEEDEQ